MSLSPESILSDLIRIDSSNPPGNETAVAMYLKKLFESAKVKCQIIEPEKGRGSFIARFGSGQKKLIYLSHADVVPAGKDWDFEPFSGKIKDELVYGRGSLDCKDLMAAQVSAALELNREISSLNGELIFIATADEEAGGRLGAGYLTSEVTGDVRADYAVNEGAEHPIIINGKMVYFLQVGEKGTAWCTLKTHGVSGHGSLPTLADNAVVKMADVINRLHNYLPEVVLIPEVEELIARLAELCSINVGALCADSVDSVLDKLSLEKPFVEALRAMTRMTVSPNTIKGGTKTNIVPDYCEAEVDIRILPGQSCEYVENELRRIIGADIEIDFHDYQPPTFTSSTDPFYKMMEEITIELVGEDTICLPIISNGSTDSKYFRKIGVPSYGIGHMAKGFDLQARTTVHGKNERTDIASLYLKKAFLEKLAFRYLA